jgi:hypothetical protein
VLIAMMAACYRDADHEPGGTYRLALAIRDQHVRVDVIGRLKADRTSEWTDIEPEAWAYGAFLINGLSSGWSTDEHNTTFHNWATIPDTPTTIHVSRDRAAIVPP